MIRERSSRAVFLFAILLSAYCLLPTAYAHADAVSDLQAQIDAHGAQIVQLNADIAAYQKQVDALGAKKNTLQSTISGLTLSAKQLGSQIQVTQNKIASANLEIRQLTLSIGDKETTIAANQTAVAKALRSIAQDEEAPLVVKLISSDSLGNAWQAADQVIQFSRALTDDINSLRNAKTVLASNRDQVSAKKDQLVSLNIDLSTQKRSVDANAAAQKQLLSETKNQESSYQKLIAQKKASEKAFEQELVNLQSQLDLIVNPTSLPKVGTGVLAWPFSAAYMTSCAARSASFDNKFCISQYFGNTPFSTANPQIYNGGGHNAVDFAAPVGTPLHAALSGTVLGTGNTDLSHSPTTGAQCYSFGKWVMIKHGNGINTMYAHLSVIHVSQGQAVTTGQVIGLSGMTGYATGPHIHFGVYATEGTKIMNLGDFRGTAGPCSRATMPVATLDAYLNPLSYL